MSEGMSRTSYLQLTPVVGSQDADSDDEGGLMGLNFGKGIHRDRAKAKRKRGRDDDEEHEPVAPGREPKKKAVDRPNVSQKELGAEYRSKVQQERTLLHKTVSDNRMQRAGGDMKKKNKPMPYAYVPLNKSQLNRR